MGEIELNNLEIQILKVLENHQGKPNRIARFVMLDQINAESPLFPVDEREMRRVIKHLTTQHGYAIGSKGGKNGGYYMCATPQEIEEVAEYYDGIGLCSFFTSSRLKKIEMKDYLGQLSLRFGG